MMGAGRSPWRLEDGFDRAAPTYDAMVALSPGYHAQLRRAAEALVDAIDHPAVTRRNTARLLDLGAGSGASTAALLRAWHRRHNDKPAPEVIAVDSSVAMLSEARAKAMPSSVSFVVQDALAHLATLPDSSVDGIFASYLLRNVPDRDRTVHEAARVLRPGAPLVIHDYSVAGSRAARAAWAAVCHAVIIPLAALKRSDVELHRYLYTSVRDFDTIPGIERRLAATGFVDLRRLRHPGWQRSMVHTVVGRVAW